MHMVAGTHLHNKSYKAKLEDTGTEIRNWLKMPVWTVTLRVPFPTHVL